VLDALRVIVFEREAQFGERLATAGDAGIARAGWGRPPDADGGP
jgi:hypothetical protein